MYRFKVWLLVIAWIAVHLELARAALPSTAELKERAGVHQCEMIAPRRVKYSGDSHDLGACLDSLHVQQIEELRITSRGGDVWPTLVAARAWEGKIDVLTVDALCASSCANYLIPIANRLVVLPDSLVMLHGALSVQQLEKYLADNRERFLRENPEMPAGVLDQEYARLLEESKEQERIQSHFEAQWLRCDDWLDPNVHYGPGEPSDELKFLIVSPAMAKRCLKHTKVDQFWWSDDSSWYSTLRTEGLLPANR